MSTKRYIVQYKDTADSTKEWLPAGYEFTSIAKAREHFNELAALPSFEWRVGFLLKVRAGHTYRLFDTKKGVTVK